MATATFGAGCFWGVEAAFRALDGVGETAVGYEGGSKSEPTYEEVCSKRTGHAEVVQVEYDEQKLAYTQLLQVFFENHDPTQMNRQGPDVGDQYRSAIFFHTPEQEKIARETVAQLEEAKVFKRPLVTQIEPTQTFWRAEEYHQQYLEKRGRASCRW